MRSLRRMEGKNIEKSGAPGGTRTPDLLVRRGISHYTPTHAVQQESIESAREGDSFRLLLYRVVPRSRTITRTICRPAGFRSRRNQCARGDNFAARFCPLPKVRQTATSDCLPDVPLQVFSCVEFAGECPCDVRVLERCARAS